jgi:hypothetical protein
MYDYDYYNCNSRFEQLQGSIEELLSSQHISNPCDHTSLPQEQPLMQLNASLNFDNQVDMDDLSNPRKMSMEEFKIDEDEVELFDPQDIPASLLELE